MCPGFRTQCLLLLVAWLPLAYGAEADGLVPGAVPGTVRFAGSGTSFGAGGRLETHAALSDREFLSSQKGRDILYFPDIPSANGDRDRQQFRFQARQSRVWLRAHRPRGERDVDAYIEWDMEETPDSYKLRLRHAYLSLGPFLAGRSYTTFVNTAALPDIDSGVAPGEIIYKRGQLRWTGTLDADTELLLALEEPDSRVVSDSDNARIRTYNDDHVPNLVARLNRYGDWGEFSVAAMLRSLRWRDAGMQMQTRAGGVGLSGRFHRGGPDNLRLLLSYGNGLGRYVTLGSYADAFYDSDAGQLHATPVLGIQAAYQHYWSQRWRSSLSLGYSRSELPPDAHADLIERTRSLQTNLLFSPVPDLSLGIEYLHARKTHKLGGSGSLNRLLFVARYEIRL